MILPGHKNPTTLCGLPMKGMSVGFSSFSGIKTLMCAEHQNFLHNSKASLTNPLEIDCPFISEKQSGPGRQGQCVFSCNLKSCSPGYTLQIYWVLQMLSGTKDQSVTSHLCLVTTPHPGPFINTDVPSPLTKIIHEKFNGTFLPLFFSLSFLLYS